MKNMQAVILAAGKSSRFWPLNKKHKSLFYLMGRPLISFTLENLKKAGIREVIIVQSQSKDIEKEMEKHKITSGLKVNYVVQKLPRGTGDALKSASKHLKEKFLVINGDDYYGASDIKKCLTRSPSLLVKEVRAPSYFGVIKTEKNLVKDIIEKPKKPLAGLINAGCYFLLKNILNEKLSKSPRGEYEITDYIKKLARKTKFYFFKADIWFSLSFSWDLLRINEFLLKNIETKIAGRVGKNCYMRNQIFIGKGTVIKSGTYIEGPVYIGENCEIGPNCYIRPFTSIGKNCRIGQAVEIKNSIVSANSRLAHLSYVGDSIIGENCLLGAGTVIANLRFDEKNIHSMIKGKLIDTGKRKFGAALGNNVKIGVNCSIMPGVLVGQDSVIGPHSLVKENIADKTIFYSK
jgi:bifunctional UDP-N-acetylglucosamine pyrophosphorylase/glucosamine-1-phosphate N-acetyltransferase